MDTLLYMLDEGDACSLLCLLGVLAFVGAKMADASPVVYQWGWRLAAGAFVGYGLYAGLTFRPLDAEAWLRVVVRGLLAAGLALGPSWVVLSVLVFAGRSLHALVGPRTGASATAANRRRERDQRRLQDEALRQHAQQEADRRAQQLQQAVAQAEASRRRTDARAAVELEYTRLCSRLGSIFTRDMLKAYFDTYMSDAYPPEDVERRGQELVATLQERLAEKEHTEERTSLEQLDSWYQAEKQQIESSSADDRLKRRLIAALNVRYADLAASLMENLQP